MTVWNEVIARRIAQQAVRRGCAIACLCSALIAVGCRPQASEKGEQTAGEAEGRTTTVTDASTPRVPNVDRLLEQVIAKYQQAPAYADSGEVTLRYRTNGRLFVDSAPYQVVFDRDDRLQLDVYQTRVDILDGRFRAKILGGTPELQTQFVDLPVRDGVHWQDVTADPALHESLAQGLGRYPIVVELLLAPQPLASFADRDQFPRKLLDSEEVDGKPCYGLQFDTEEGPFQLWVDEESLVVRRVVFPVRDIARKMEAESGATEIRVVAELRDARFAKAAQDELTPLKPAKDDIIVQRFAVPPDPLPTNLLGKEIPPFELTYLDGQPFLSSQSAGQVTVFHWFVDHPSCEASMALFDAAAAKFAERDDVAFYAVCVATDETPAEDIMSLAERWGIRVPVLRDSDAVGRDVFQIPALPAIMALGADSRLQIYEITYIPELDSLLHEALQKHLGGADLAAEVLQRFEEARIQYQRALETGNPVADRAP